LLQISQFALNPTNWAVSGVEKMAQYDQIIVIEVKKFQYGFTAVYLYSRRKAA